VIYIFAGVLFDELLF